MASIEEQDNNVGGLPILKKDTQETEIGGLPVLKKKSSQYISSPISSQLASQEPNLPDFEKGKKIAEIGFTIPQNEIGRAVEKDKKVEGSTVAGLYNTLVGSISSLGGGFAYMSDVLGAPAGIPLNVRVANAEADRAKVADFIQKARSSASSPEFEKQQGQFDITNGVDIQDIKGLGFQAPKTLLDMGIGVLTGSGSYFVQAINDGQKELDESGNADKLSPTQKVGYLFTQGAVQAALEKVGLDRVLGRTGITKKVGQKLTAEVVDEFVQKGVKATAKDIENAVLSKATKLVSKIKNVGLNAATSALVEGGTEGIQQGASDAIKTITNKIAGNDIFDQEDINSNFLKNIVNNAFAGGVMGGVVSGGISAYNNTNKAIRSQIAAVQSPEDLANLQAQIGEQVEKGNITPQEAEEANIKAEDYAKIAAKIPAQVSTEDKYKIIGGIDQRNQLETAMQNATNELDNLDESFKGQKQDEIALIQSKLNQVNDYIGGIIGGKEFEYKEKEGKFYKIDSEGKENTITKQDYEIAKAVEEENKRKGQIKEAETKAVPVRILSSEEPPMREGERIVTITGKTEEERQNTIEQRKKETFVKPQVLELNKLIQEADLFAKQNKNYKKSSQGLQELNSLRTRVRDMAAKYPEFSGLELQKEKIVKPSTTKGFIGKMNIKRAVRYNSKAEGDAAIQENGKLLTDRDKNIQDIFQEFNDSNIFLDFKQDTGIRMSDAQLDATIQDILDGIPSKRANRYLDEFENAISKNEIPLYDKTLGEEGLSLEMIREAMGINKETIGEPMDEESLMNFLDGESSLTPEEESELTDNIENLIQEYESEFEPKTRVETEIQPVETKSKEGVTSEAEQIANVEKAKPIEEQLKEKENAVQESSTEGVLPLTSSGVGKEGGRRKRMGQRVQGEEIAKESEQVKVDEEGLIKNKFLYTGTDEERQKGLLKNLMESDIPNDYKKGLEEKGLTYKVSNQVEASESAKAIINSLGITDALEIARSEKIDPSVGSAIYSESLNNLWSNERRLKADGKIEQANVLGKQWSDITLEYANKLNSKGKWTAQVAYFYKTSPLGFAIRIENERVEQFQTWYENKEKDYKKVFNEILKSEEGQALLKEEVEKISKEERAKARADKRQKIDEFFENAKLKGNNLYAIPIPPQLINGALEVMKKAVLAGESVTNAVSMAVEHISKEVKDWDKEKFRKEYEEKLNKVTNESVRERDNEKVLLKRIEELKRRIKENDFSAEEYKAKKTLSEKEQAAKNEYDKVKKLYDENKKQSPEYIDKKAKQYLDKLRQRLRGIDEAKKEEIIRRSIKEIVNSGGLEYAEFKDIVSETIGIKKLTDEQKSQIESLTEQSNIADDLEQKFLDNPTKENIDAFKKAKANSLDADRKLFEMTSQKSDIVGTLKSLITLNYLGASTLIKNYAQNVIYQATVRFPTSLGKRVIDQSVYGATYMANKMFGTKVIKPSISISDAQRGYFKEYRDGIIRGWDQMIKGVDEKDYFATNQYASSLNPKKSFNDLKAAMKGELFLSKGQKIDKFIQATLGWQPYAISRGMIYGDKPPRYAAQGAEALQIANKELGITDPFETEAFMLSPEKYAYNYLIKKSGLSPADAAIESKSISKRIVDAGAVATFQNENMLNNLISKIDEWAVVKKEDQWTAKVVKPPVALLKATTIPFLKTPANIYWAYFKLANPALTMTKSLVEVGLAQNALKKGDLIGYREYNKKSKESFGTAMIGLAITAGAAALAAKGLIRTSVQDEDKAREKAGEGFFGKSNELNLGAMTGGDDFWVDLSWFGPVGTIIDVRGRMMEDNKQKELKGKKIDDGIMNDIVSTMGYSITSTLNSLIFDQGAKIVDAIRKGYSGGLNQVVVNNANALGNVVLGSTIPAINKALAPEKPDLAADNILDQIANNQKQRNVFVTWAKGYPPSRVSIWGEPITQDRTVSGVIGSMLGFEKGSADKFGAILYNEQRRTGINEFFPPVEDKKIKVNGEDVTITVQEKRDLDTYIGQARKVMVSPFINDKSIYTVFLNKGEEVADFTYSELTAGKNKAGQIISQEEADRVKLAALSIIYENGKKAGFSKFKEKYIQYQDATLNVEKLQKQALESAEKTIFKAKIEQPSQ
jgi:hypothetical protein